MSNTEVIRLNRAPRIGLKLINYINNLARILSPNSRLFSLGRFAQRMLSAIQPATHAHIKRAPTFLRRRHNQPLTVVSANLCHDWPRYRHTLDRLEAFARLVERQHADILLLQEVSRTQYLHVDEWLADRLGMAYLYARANGSSAINFEEGLAIFSRFPLSQPVMKTLGHHPSLFVRRIALGAQLDTHQGEMLVYSVHLGIFDKGNLSQTADLHRWIEGNSHHMPVLVGGDFNSHESTIQMRRSRAAWLDAYRHIHPHGQAVTHTWKSPWGTHLRKRRLDYIFLRQGKTPLHILESSHLQTPGLSHSDHRVVLTRLSASSLYSPG